MRWEPDEPICGECGFDWRRDKESAIAEVGAGPARAMAALRGVRDPTARRGDRWSAAMYVWHLVDVLRIGTERLLTLALEPASGIPCWDENALADVRHYDRLSVVVGLAVLRRATTEWLEVAETTPESATVRHAVFGPLRALDIIRRNAHEVHHHVQDIAR